jgi:spore coat protein U-like protein
MTTLLVTGASAAPSTAGEVQATMTVSASVIGSAEIDARAEPVTTSAGSPITRQRRLCTTVAVRCTAASPLRVAIEGATGSRQAVAACPVAAGDGQPMQSCLDDSWPPQSDLTISIEY